MDFEVIRASKDEVEVKLENVTLAEILRTYLNKNNSVDVAAWRQDHPTEKPILFVRTKTGSPKKAILSTISTIVKDLDKVESEFKNLK